MNEANNAQAIIDYAKQREGVEFKTIDDPREPDQKIPVAVLTQGKTLESVKHLLDEFADQPERREGRAAIRSLQSFIDHANRFKDDDSAIFAVPDESKPRLISVFDYHIKGPSGRPRFRRHQGIYEFELSKAWQEWKAIDGKELKVPEFAEFLEDHVEDVIDPAGLADNSSVRLLAEKLNVALASPSAVMRVSRGMAVHVTQNVTQVVNLETGEMNVQFEQKQNSADQVKVPASFAIGIPVFRGDVFYQIAVRLRHVVRGPVITWTMNLYRTDKVFDLAFSEACAKAVDQTKLPLFYGTPE